MVRLRLPKIALKLAVIAAPSAPTVFVLTNTSGTEIVFEVDGAQGSSMRIEYRAGGSGAWSLSDILETPTNGETITISGLSVSTLYQFVVYSFSSAGAGGTKSVPGSIIETSTPADGSDLTASGGFSLVLENLRTLIAASSNFQNWIGVGNSDAAKAHIFFVKAEDANIPEDGNGVDKPYCIIDHDGDYTRGAIADGNAGTWLETGSLYFKFSAPVTAAYQEAGEEQNAAKEYYNNVGPVMKDIADLSRQGGFLIVGEVSLVAGPTENEMNKKSNIGQRYESEHSVTFGE